MDDNELLACTPLSVDRKAFNRTAVIPYGVTTDHIRAAMEEFIDFLGFVNSQLHTKQIDRLESFLMPANFSSIVGEFVGAAIPKHCKTVCRNLYHNGHPDILPKGRFDGDCIQHGSEGIEIKGSRHPSGWQGHNAENVWLMSSFSTRTPLATKARAKRRSRSASLKSSARSLPKTIGSSPEDRRPAGGQSRLRQAVGI